MNTSDQRHSQLVSVIMPVRNQSEHVAEAIQSVLDQSWISWGLLVCDDGSTDNSVDIVQRYARKNPRITLLISKNQGGPARARNQGIARAKGRWIAFLDSDDIWHPKKLSETLDFATRNCLALTYTSYIRKGGGGTVSFLRPPQSSTVNY